MANLFDDANDDRGCDGAVESCLAELQQLLLESRMTMRTGLLTKRSHLHSWLTQRQRLSNVDYKAAENKVALETPCCS